MSQTNFEEFQELVEQFEGEMSLKSICEQERVPYRAYISLIFLLYLMEKQLRYIPTTGESTALAIMTEIENKIQTEGVFKVSVRMEFENGIRFQREERDVESFIEFLIKINPVLCLS